MTIYYFEGLITLLYSLLCERLLGFGMIDHLVTTLFILMVQV